MTPLSYRIEFRRITGPEPDSWRTLDAVEYAQPPIVPRAGEEVWISSTGANWRVDRLWHFPAHVGAVRPTWEVVVYVSPIP